MDAIIPSHKEIRDVYTGFLFEMVFGPFVGGSTGDISGIILQSLSLAGIKTKAFVYRRILVAATGGHIIGFQFLVCPNDVCKLKAIIGEPGRLSGVLTDFPAFISVGTLIPLNTPVVVSIEEAVVISTKCSPSLRLRLDIICRLVGSGFSVDNLLILGKNLIFTVLPSDITPLNDAKLAIGALLPLLGKDISKCCCCTKECSCPPDSRLRSLRS